MKKFKSKNISESILIDSMLKKLALQKLQINGLAESIIHSYNEYLLPKLKHKFKLLEKFINAKYRLNMKLHPYEFNYNSNDILFSCEDFLKSKYIAVAIQNHKNENKNYSYNILDFKYKNSKISLFSKFPKEWINLSDDKFIEIISKQLIIPQKLI